jgi:maltose alpha-D-glucosyltransferase/alpha-amylase
MSFPGTPVIYYGDEIGMGDNIYLGDRNGVRTPMQWSPDRNGGFSRCDPARLYLPMVMDAVYGYESVNVESQSRSLGSLLSWTKRLIAVRKSSQVFGRGSLSFIRPTNRSVLVFVRQYQGDVLLCIANLSRSAQAAEIDLSPWRGRIPREMLGRKHFPPIGDHPYVVTIAPYGFYWFQLIEPTESVEAPSLVPEFETLVLSQGWSSILQGRTRSVVERDVLPAFLGSRRWFAERGNTSVAAELKAIVRVSEGDPGPALALIEARGKRETANYLLPLTVEWRRFESEHRNANALAAVRRGPREGTLLDATTDVAFIGQVLDKIRTSETLVSDAARLEFRPVGAFPDIDPAVLENVRAISTEQSNTTALVGEEFVVKLFRRLEPGINPEIEIGRFLTEAAPFENVPPLIGTVELADGAGRSAVAVVHQFVQNQGDAWSVTNAYLDRYVEEQRLLTAEVAEESDEQAAYLRRMQQVGRRVAEMQLALASRDDVPEFAPEPITPADVEAWTDDVLERAQRVFAELTHRQASLKENDRALVDAILPHRETLPAHLRRLLPASTEAGKIRHHGDLHLGQMLVVKEDVVIIDFEGEPRRSIEERRRKAPPARDLAGLIRSIDYSATAALMRALETSPDENGRVEQALDSWREHSVDAVLSAYRQFLTDIRLWPPEPAATRLFDFFLLEKVFYEIEYELAHRPDWLRVPLIGIARILSRGEEVAA